MGVPGLWEVLRPAGTSRSLTEVAADGFTHHDARACRIGVDASIWFVHATYGKEGENPELRTIFFRLTRLLKLPFLPLFVFDGPMRPDIKRGKSIDKKPHWMIQGMQRMLEAFGFEWRTAPGEAEAELAYLNHIGVIDSVLSDDVDTLVFGAHSIIRNPSENLSGNTTAQATKNHTMTFCATDIEKHAKVGLTCSGLILVALLSGGDYHKGVDGCGIQAAVALARAGFGDPLVAKVKSLALRVQHAENKRTRVKLSAADEDELERFLSTWRTDVADELRTNSKKFLAKKSLKAASNLLAMGSSFPDVDVLMAYINPVTSEERAVAKAVKQHSGVTDTSSVVIQARRKIAEDLRAKITWPHDPGVGAIAKVCEDYFEWGYKEMILKRFANWLWEGIVCRHMRRKAIAKTHLCSVAGRDESYEDASHPLIVTIHSSRTHATTGGLLEHRLEIDPARLAAAAEHGITGRREAVQTGWSDEDEDQDDDNGQAKKLFDPLDHLRVWMLACMVEEAEADVVQTFNDKKARKVQKMTKKKSAKKPAVQNEESSSEDSPAPSQTRATSTPAHEPTPIPIPVPIEPRLKPRGVDDVFKARKPLQPAPMLKKSKPQPASTIARVASLFDDPDIASFKDLTRSQDPPLTVPKLTKAYTDPGPSSLRPNLGSSSSRTSVKSSSSRAMGPPSDGARWKEVTSFKDLTVPRPRGPLKVARTWVDTSPEPSELKDTVASSTTLLSTTTSSAVPSSSSRIHLKAPRAPPTRRRVHRSATPVLIESSSEEAEEPPCSQTIPQSQSSSTSNVDNKPVKSPVIEISSEEEGGDKPTKQHSHEQSSLHIASEVIDLCSDSD